MRKHNKKFAQRWSRQWNDRSNFPQVMAHNFVKDKSHQFWAHGLLQKLLARVGLV